MESLPHLSSALRLLPPATWSSLFIIDPALTLTLLLACCIAWAARERRAEALVEHQAGRTLATVGLQNAPRFSVRMPFNTLLWRLVAVTPEGFVEGGRSLVADRGAMQFARIVPMPPRSTRRPDFRRRRGCCGSTTISSKPGASATSRCSPICAWAASLMTASATQSPRMAAREVPAAGGKPRHSSHSSCASSGVRLAT